MSGKSGTAVSTTKKSSAGDKTYSTVFITALYAAFLKANNNKLSIDFKHMSAASGNAFSPSSCEHQLRDIRKAAAELNKELGAKPPAPGASPNANVTPTPKPPPTMKRPKQEDDEGDSPSSGRAQKAAKVKNADDIDEVPI